jgi:hypothetical protein
LSLSCVLESRGLGNVANGATAACMKLRLEGLVGIVIQASVRVVMGAFQASLDLSALHRPTNKQTSDRCYYILN